MEVITHWIDTAVAAIRQRQSRSDLQDETPIRRIWRRCWSRACTGCFAFSSCNGCSRAMFSCRSRSSSLVCGSDVVGGSMVVVAAGAAALRASRDRCGAFLLHFLEVL